MFKNFLQRHSGPPERVDSVDLAKKRISKHKKEFIESSVSEETAGPAADGKPVVDTECSKPVQPAAAAAGDTASGQAVQEGCNEQACCSGQSEDDEDVREEVCPPDSFPPLTPSPLPYLIHRFSSPPSRPVAESSANCGLPPSPFL